MYVPCDHISASIFSGAGTTGTTATTDEDKFETPAATDSSGINFGDAGNTDSNKAQTESTSSEKQEVDNESLVVHVDEPSLLELDADLTKPESKAAAEDSTPESQRVDNKDAQDKGKEKWEFEGQEKKEGDVSKESAGKPVGSTDGTKTADKAADKDAAGNKQESQSPSTGDSQRRRFVANTSSLFQFLKC